MATTLATGPFVEGHSPTIHDLPAAERPRERLLQYGAARLSNAELLAVLLRTGVAEESALALGQRLQAYFGGLRGVAATAYGELSAVRWISQAKYCELMAWLELSRRLAAVLLQD